MKTKRISAIILSLFIILILVLVFANVTQPVAANTATLSLQTTPTPQAGDRSVIGSTDGILVMGIVIVLIVTLPLLFRKKGK
ncbi:MAG: hypothetical protein JNM02_01400 [Anaerolineales bacterium]|nr:hypothetical protein [Anaerolineales bacterium]